MRFAASRLDVVQPSASAWVSQAAKEARSQGADIIDLGMGEPDFDTPPHIVEAAHQAALNGETRYPPTVGTQALRAAVVDKLKRENNLDHTPDEIIISNGAKQVLFNAFLATIEPGDEVILCAPYFGPYKDIVLLLGGVPKVIECPASADFRLLPAQLEAAITPKTRWLLLNHPSNPAGAVYTAEELAGIGRVLAAHRDVLVLSDEIYEHIQFDGRTFSSFAAVNPGLKDRVLTVNGVSKAYAMTGWRIGYGAGHPELIKAMVKVQSQVSSGACSIAQAAAAAALKGPQDDVRRFCAAYERRRNLVVDGVARIPGLTLDAPGGAFYAFIGCSDLIGAEADDGTVMQTDADLTGYLLDEAGVAAVPGAAYGLSPFIRISTASADEVLEEAITRVERAVGRLNAVS